MTLVPWYAAAPVNEQPVDRSRVVTPPPGRVLWADNGPFIRHHQCPCEAIMATDGEILATYQDWVILQRPDRGLGKPTHWEDDPSPRGYLRGATEAWGLLLGVVVLVAFLNAFCGGGL